jgi:hypothetical protein
MKSDRAIRHERYHLDSTALDWAQTCEDAHWFAPTQSARDCPGWQQRCIAFHFVFFAL